VANTIDQLDEQQTGASESKEVGALKALWDLFSSMKTAIVLLLALAAVSIVITVVNAKRGDDSSAAYQTPWYLMLLTLVGINLAVCSINRFKQAWRRTFQPNLRAEPAQLKKAAASESLTSTGTVDEVTAKVEKALRSRAYVVAKEERDGAVNIHAAKGRVAIWGPYLTHLSILVIFIGAVWGSRTGFEGTVNVTEGKKQSTYSVQQKDKTGQFVAVDKPLNFELGLKKFEIKYDEQHNPTGYKSDLQVYDGGKQVTRKVIDVNHPLSYKGITFFQSSYGLESISMTVTGPDGKSTKLPFAVQMGADENGQQVYNVIGMNESGMALETVTAAGKKLTIFVHNLAPDYVGGEQISGSSLPLNPAVQVYVNEDFPKMKDGAWKPVGWLTVGQSEKYKGFTITFDRVVQYTGLSVARNPGLPLIYLGFGLLVLGIFISFYLTHRTIRVHIALSGKKVGVTAGAFSRTEAATFEKDLARLRHELEA